MSLAALLVVLLRLASAVPRKARPAASHKLSLAWGAGRAGEVVGFFALPLLPARLAAGWLLRLRQAELDSLVSVQQWLGARFIYGAAACVLVLAVVRPWHANDLPLGLSGAVLGFWLPGFWLRDRAALQRSSLLKDLPSYLDLLTLAVEAGGSLTGALRMAVEKAPPSLLRRAFERVLNDIRAGRSRMDALAATAHHLRIEPLTAVTNALIQAESAGMSLGSILRAQAEQRLNERFAAAERLAMQAPVKMLGPLILCIFPCTFIVIGFPIAIRLMGGAEA